MENEIKKILANYIENYHQEVDVINIIQRDICYSVDNPTGGILITGINPSYNKNDKGQPIPFKFIDADEKKGYWKKTKEMIGGIVAQTAYLDLFPLKFSNQSEFTYMMQKSPASLSLMSDLLQVTQREIERLAPKLIIVKNAQTAAYWGREDNCVWMGYKFEKIPNHPLIGMGIDVRRVVGFKDDPKNERVLKIDKTNLEGSIIVFYALYDARHEKTCPQKILNSADIKKLFEYASNK